MHIRPNIYIIMKQLVTSTYFPLKMIVLNMNNFSKNIKLKKKCLIEFVKFNT